MTIALYAGSFDPPTHGHEDVIRRAAKVFEKLVVGVGNNSSKTPYFLAWERARLISDICSDVNNLEVKIFNGLLVNFCKEMEATVIIRGLRAVTDFEVELGIAHVNAQQNPDIYTFFLVTKPDNSFVSSSAVKELIRYGGDISYYVHPSVIKAMKRKMDGT
jgi:pantetheine-phosphate adenylyltransferase